MFKALGRFAAKHPWFICLAWMLAAVGVSIVAPSWSNRALDDDIRFMPDRCDSVRGYRLLETAFPQDVFASRLIFAVERADGPLTGNDLKLVEEFVADLNQLRQDEPKLQIHRIASRNDPYVGNRFMSPDGRCTLIQVSLSTPYLALQTRATVDRAEQRLRARLAQAGPDAPAVYATGQAGIGRDLTSAGGDSLDKTTIATIVLVIVILLLVYRSPILALVPLVSIAISVWVALKLLAICTLIPGFYLVNISQIFAVVMLYGAGTDYCLFLISRYREELAHGRELPRALASSVASVGGALAASAGTVICGLGMMGLAEFAKVRSGGPAIAVSIAVALVASLTLAPALLRLLGKAAFWPVGMPTRTTAAQKAFGWNWISRKVVAHPLLVWATAVMILLPLAFVGFEVHANYRATGELADTCSSVRGLDAIQRHFTAGETGPITVLLESPVDWNSKAGQQVISHLSQGFARLDNVAEVRSLTQPLGKPLNDLPPEQSPASQPPGFVKNFLSRMVQGVSDQVHAAVREFYVARLPAEDEKPARYVTRLDVVANSDPFDPRSVETLQTLQVWLRNELPRSTQHFGEIRSECYGVTVNAHDLAVVSENDRFRINTMVLGGIFLILLVLVRRFWLAAYLLVTVLLSYFATLGATTLFTHWWLGRALGEVDWRVPFFLFTILVAVGEDYNILLISRALHERKKYGARKGMRLALARTGGTITSCGLIMAGTFATLMLAGLNTLVQIGFALAFGVLLDTFIVRPFLVPSLTYWVWKKEEEAVQIKPQVTLAKSKKTRQTVQA